MRNLATILQELKQWKGGEFNSSQRSNDSTMNSNALTGRVSQMINLTDDTILSDLLQQVFERATVLGK